MSDGLFIDDGYTQTRTVPAVAGLHPDLTVVFRPALARERHAYRQRLAVPDPAVIDAHEADLITRHTVSVNGGPLDRPKVDRLKPAVRAILVDLVLGYTPADEAKDAGNSRSG